MPAAPARLGILTTDAGLVIRSWDGWLTEATGLPLEEVSGRPLADVAPAVMQPVTAARLRETLAAGAVQVFSPALHGPFIPCPPQAPSETFTQMQQRVHVGPLLDGERIAGLVVTIVDVTAQLEAERALANDMASPDPERRREAAGRVAEAGRVESLDPFTRALEADDWKVRRAAVQGLAAAADAHLLESVVESLQRTHRNFSALSSALKLLALSDASAVAPLSRLLDHADPDLRIQAALALGDQHDERARAALIRALHDPDVNVRFHAIESLGRLRATDAVEALTSIAEARDYFLSFAAIEALAIINDRSVAPRLVPLLEDDTLRPAAAAALAAIGDSDAVPALIGTLNATADAGAATTSVAAALVAIHDRAADDAGRSADLIGVVRQTVDATGERRLLASLDRSAPADLLAVVRILGWLRRPAAAGRLATLLHDPDLRTEVVEALVSHGDAAVEPTLRVLDAEDDDVRAAAVAVLGRLGSRRTTPSLLPLLESDPDMVIAVAGALARIGDAGAFEALLGRIGDPNPAVRQAIVGALNSIGHPEMPARITRLLEAEDAGVRESAVRIAGYFGYAESTDAIFARIDDSDEPVRIAALEHLPYFDDPRTLTRLCAAMSSPAPRLRAAAARALGRLDHASWPAELLGALDDPDPWVRYYAVRAVGEDPAQMPVTELMERAASDPAAHVRIAACDALGRSADSAPVVVLLRCAADPDEDVAAAALAALGQLGVPEALPRLTEVTRSPSEVMRRAAVQSLASLGTPDAVELLQWLAAANDARHADMAIRALGTVASSDRSGAETAVAALVQLQGDVTRSDAAMRTLAALPASLVPSIARGLAHPQETVRQRSVDVLGAFPAEQSSAALERALTDRAASVRQAGVAALARLGAVHLRERILQLAGNDPSNAVRRAASAAAARLRYSG